MNRTALGAAMIAAGLPLLLAAPAHADTGGLFGSNAGTTTGSTPSLADLFAAEKAPFASIEATARAAGGLSEDSWEYTKRAWTVATDDVQQVFHAAQQPLGASQNQ
ncbi:hypothetical protein [Streptomyces griseiscabiei]|uniref:Secreted protein n=1 Tax=Streptomyces griseiscabiei TaxID=2993540 RepID=A0ABU4LLP3_9ACTN|nr:hypothetical protein [Streptomyces griseiscabiei]MBZ3908529.1 hypothetical protein [Streptomyces griseiscabiei]MDX2916375.1 hypothetical protein [Streptomyces griseiscabiei]